MQQSPMKDIQVRFFVACPLGAPFCPDYSILQDPANHEMVQRAKGDGKRILICKEELGNNTKKGECSYQVLPSPSEYAAVRPIFLIRDPIRVFDSWRKMGWTDVQSLIDCFNNLFGMLKQADSSLISCLLYEQLTQQPRREIKRVCSRWGIPFSDNMLEFSAPFGTSFVYKNPAEKDTYCHRQPPGLFSTVKASSTIEENVPSHGLVTNDEKDIIEHNLGELYLACWRDHVLQLSHILAEKPWIGFDLDDTLHEFRRASSNASNKVLEAMQERYAVPFAALKSQYSEILRSSTSNAFSDGKSSSEYRRDRFLAVAKHFDLPLKPDDPFLSQLLGLYETALKDSLELKSGALSLLKAIKRLGKQIVIITEGPQDAQEWTIENLGLTAYVDFLATTNHFKVSKTNGLFSKVLETLGITPSEIAYVGDSEQRDIVPATAEGMFCFHFAEGKNCNLEACPPRINTLNKLEYILSCHENRHKKG
ncbi:Haloacid dehalogenase-like hydrolase [Xylaria sp. FL0933]|nr:Haloacid dehalogenase-like hydrolase [Xylaria sp. FL0933]